MFSENLNKIMESLGLTIKTLAGQMECDRSYIQRLCSGERVPKQNGRGAYNIADALYSAADMTGQTEKLNRLISCENASSADRIRDAVIAFLYDGENAETAKSRRGYAPRTGSVSYSRFGTRFNAVMELTGISNIRLGKLVNTDPSYISRFRSGFRSPKANPKMMNDIASVLLDRVFEHRKTDALAELMDISPAETEDRENAFALFYDWLYDAERSDSAVFIEGLLDSIGEFSADDGQPLFTFEQAADSAVLSEDAAEYYGCEGLQRAVIRFLGNVVKRRSEAVYLYSDQNMDWMTADRGFFAKWASLMMMCVNNGTHIYIIHNINRSMPEMAAAIKSWLPLYPSGMIHAYYCRPQSNVRFSTTLFLCPGYACISGSNIMGYENSIGMYRYDTGQAALAARRAAYEHLMERASPLVSMIKTDGADIGSIADTSETVLISGTLSFATMPEQVIRSALRRNGQEEGLNDILAMLGKSAALLPKTGTETVLCECLYLPADEELFGDRVYMDIPGRRIAYTPEEYGAHIRNIAGLLESTAGYRLCVLPQPPFNDLKIIITKNLVAVSRLKPPFVTFIFRHPDMCRAFMSYANTFRKQYCSDKVTVLQLLEKYV